MEFMPRSFTLRLISTVLVPGFRVERVSLVFLESLEVSKLIEAEKYWRPKAGIVDVAFVDQQLPADDFVARVGVAGELDTAHENCSSVDVHGQIDLVAVGFNVDLGLAHVIDVSEVRVYLSQILDAVAQFLGGERVAQLHLEETGEKLV